MHTKLNQTTIFFLLFLFLYSFAKGQNVAPELMATGNQFYCPKSEINIVTDFEIIDLDDAEIDKLYIQISEGYIQGEDILQLPVNFPYVEESWSAIEGKLTLSSDTQNSMSYLNAIAAVKAVTFSSTSEKPIGKTFSISVGSANYLPLTGHYYEYVADYGITWTEAKIAAENRTYFGLQGYLVTITSDEEAQISGEQTLEAGWIGGTDVETEGVWKWVTGPEAGTIFWASDGSVSGYSFWNINQPDNAHGGPGEDYAHITDVSIGVRGAWNDLRIGGDPPGPYHPKGYIVEYGGMPGDPILNIATSSSIYTSSIASVNSADICGPGIANLEAQTDGLTDVLWFDAPDSNTPIFTGNIFTTPVLNATTTYYVLASSNNCVSGSKVPVVATVNEIPDIETSLVFKNCDVDGVFDGDTNFNLEQANTIVAKNQSHNFLFSYFNTRSDAEMNVNALQSTIVNNSTFPVVYIRVENEFGCYAVSEVHLEASTTSFPVNFVVTQENCDNDGVNDGFYSFNLAEISNELIAQLPANQNLSVSYYRNEVDAQLEENKIDVTSNFVNETPFKQQLFVRVENSDNGNCYGIGQHVELVVNELPNFKVGQYSVFCSDDSAASTTLFVYDNKESYTYQWKDNLGTIVGNNSELVVNTNGVYEVLATSASGCISNPVIYEVLNSEKAIISEDAVLISEENSKYNITIDTAQLGNGDYEFALDDYYGAYQDQNVFSGVLAGTHVLYVRDKNHCGTVSFEIFIFGYPKFFTPNSDGINDVWQLAGVSNRFTNASTVSIYNRYGKLIKQFYAKQGAWDGSYKGQLLPKSDYWFVAKLLDNSGNEMVYKGHFSLIL